MTSKDASAALGRAAIEQVSNSDGMPRRLVRGLVRQVGKHVDDHGFNFTLGERVLVTVLPKR